MNRYGTPVLETFQRPCGVICGVCAALAARLGVPAWVVRVPAVLFLLTHTVIAVAIYLAAAFWMRRHPDRAAPSSGLTDKLRALDRRLARMEEEALHQAMHESRF